MLLTLLSYLPVVIAPLLAIGLATVLQHWVKPHTQPATGTGLVPATDNRQPRLTWADITTHANPVVAYVLPIVTSAAIVVLALWPFAYVGWAVIELDPDPGWSAQVPPWFGNPGYFLGFSVVGVMVAVAGGILAVAVAVGLHALGKCILWPEVCGCDETEADGPEAGDSQADERDE